MHSENTIAAIMAGFPTSLRMEVTEVMERISPAELEPIAEPAFEVMTAEASIKVPCRVYFPEITTLSNLTPLQSGLLAAIMSRHHSGYQRQAWLRQLLKFPTTWGVPYLTAAVGEYVIEILLTLDQELSPEWEKNSLDFSRRNPKWCEFVSRQVLSYWTIFHWHAFPKLTESPGYRIAQRLGLWDEKVSRRRIRRERLKMK